jgi:5'-3' exoribonuclease 2
LTEEELNKLAAKKMKDVIKNMLEDQSKKRADKYVDKVRLGEDGWKARYYSDKFHVPQDELHEFLPIIKRYYLEGLQWVYSYYYNGCASWTWFYPFHYAPFAGDLVGITHIDIKFELGEPAQPFEQLMGVFPKQSAHAVPLCYRNLMSDPQSEIIDFYPTNFHIDINGARYEWMGVVLLPFIDRKRLLHAMNKADRNREALSSHEKELNKFGKVYIFFENEARAESRLTQTLVEYHNTT